jgi:hypothetical protein
MGAIPDIFRLLDLIEPWRGAPAAYGLLLAAGLVFLLPDWRGSLFALTGLYLVAGALFVDVLDARLAAIKVLVGLFVTLVMYMTGRQVNWGRLPVDIAPEEATRWQPVRLVTVGRFRLPADVPARLVVVVAAALLIGFVVRQETVILPVVPEHFTWAVLGLAVFGVAGLGLTTEPFRAGLALLMLLLGFELIYGAMESSAAALFLLALANLVLSLVIAYLTQTRYAFQALVD